MSILKIICPYCNFSYVLPENKVPSGELTVTCQNCKQTYTYAKPGLNTNLKVPVLKGGLREPDIFDGNGRNTPVENRHFYRQASATKPAILRDEPKTNQGSSAKTFPPASEAENKPATDWESLPKKPAPVQDFTENTPKASAMEEISSLSRQPVITPEEPKAVDASPDISQQIPAIEEESFLDRQPVAPSEEAVPAQTSTENILKAPPREEGSLLNWQPATSPEESASFNTSAEISQETPAYVKPESENLKEPEQVHASEKSVSKTSAAVQSSPAPTPVKKAIQKQARLGAGKKWGTAAALGCVIAIGVSIAVYKPAAVTGLKDMPGILSVNIKKHISSIYLLVNEKLEPKPVAPAPSQPGIEIPAGAAIVRPPNFREIAGTWTGTLRNDRRGTRWTFSFNPTNYNVSIKNESGLWVKGTAVFHWDKGSLIGDTLRTAPKWNSLDIDIIKSSVSEYAGKVSLGAFSRNENALKLCMSSPGKMIEPTETDSTGEIQCFDLKKKGSAN